ncbi:MAG: TraR/DksA family transcriptional regulator [Angustibacter sp.]
MHSAARAGGSGRGATRIVGATTNLSRELLKRRRRALDRVDDGTFGVCESCGEPIGKTRRQASSRATLCVSCT